MPPSYRLHSNHAQGFIDSNAGWARWTKFLPLSQLTHATRTRHSCARSIKRQGRRKEDKGSSKERDADTPGMYFHVCVLLHSPSAILGVSILTLFAYFISHKTDDLLKLAQLFGYYPEQNLNLGSSELFFMSPQHLWRALERLLVAHQKVPAH